MPPPRTYCIVDGCEKRVHGHGYCDRHYRLWKRNGRPERVNRRDKRNFTVNGYVRVWAPHHPCANSGGYALEHRKVWHDANGPIPDGYQIHHRNGDKTDNRIENLELLSSSEHARQHAQENGYIVNQHGRWPLRADPNYGRDSCTTRLP